MTLLCSRKVTHPAVWYQCQSLGDRERASNEQVLVTFATGVGVAPGMLLWNEERISVRACVINAEAGTPLAWMILPKTRRRACDERSSSG